MVPYRIHYGCYLEQHNHVKNEQAFCTPRSEESYRLALSIPHLPFLKELIHDLVSLFRILIVLESLGVVFHRALTLAADRIDFGDAMVRARIFLIALERPAEDVRRLLELVFA